MNLLIDEPPKSLWLGKREYAIRWDFRTAALYEMMMLDEDVAGAEKPLLALRLFYPELPQDPAEGLEGIQWFYRCGITTEAGKKRSKGGREQIYSFAHDDAYIYSAFMEQYGIDLMEERNLHWWKFKALFQGLKEDCAFCKIMGYRSTKISDSMSKEQQDFYRQMKEFYRIPFHKGEEEKWRAIEGALLESGDLTGLLCADNGEIPTKAEDR